MACGDGVVRTAGQVCGDYFITWTSGEHNAHGYVILQPSLGCGPKFRIAHRRTLVAREEEDGKIKASWTNAPQGLSWEELADVQAQRHWIERTFQDCKSQLSMAQ